MYWIYLLEAYLCIQDISIRGVSMYTGCIYWKYTYRHQTYLHQKYTYIIIESRSQIDIGQILNIYLDIPIDEDIQQLKEKIEVVQLDILKYRLRYLIDRYQIHRDVGQIQKIPFKQIKVPIDNDFNSWRRLQKEEKNLYFR